jgi:hypothetical protein
MGYEMLFVGNFYKCEVTDSLEYVWQLWSAENINWLLFYAHITLPNY